MNWAMFAQLELNEYCLRQKTNFGLFICVVNIFQVHTMLVRYTMTHESKAGVAYF